MRRGTRRAVFFDRDGTLLDCDGYLGDPACVVLLPGVGPALAAVAAMGYERVVVSNQSGVGRGLFTERDYLTVEAAFVDAVEREGGGIEAVYACHHLPGAAVMKWDAACDCRKPEPGMLLRAARERGIDCARSIAVGDMGRDVVAGKRAGVAASLLVRTGKGRAEEPALDGLSAPDAVVDSVVDLPAWLEGFAKTFPR